VQLANQALDEVRRAYWNELRSLGDQNAAKRFKDARCGPDRGILPTSDHQNSSPLGMA
jgi:hypothetical protein